LLHYGDVIFLLDLIHEINLERDEKKLPRVESLDFYPRYHAGMPYKSEWEFDTYGISWKCKDNDAVQRGVLAILMLAVLKSRKMKIGLLMDKNAALMTYLSNIPMVPGKVFAFLDGLYRFLDLKAAKPVDENAAKQAMYDLLKAVRGGLERLKYDYPKYYLEKMGRGIQFCCSCGYELLREFFVDAELCHQPHRMICSGCMLRQKLDDEKDHQKKWAKNIMTVFYPDWKRNAFNIDAPILADGRDLVRFKTAKIERDPPPSMVVLDDGEFYQPEYKAEFVRDTKFQFDSVQGLPTLVTLLKAKELRQEARDLALFADAKRILALYLQDLVCNLPAHQYLRPALVRVIAEQGAPNHHDEQQGRPIIRNRCNATPTHTFGSAIAMYKTLDEPCKDVFGPCEDEGDDFWTPNGKVKEGFW
jgi:hypothetical protein